MKREHLNFSSFTATVAVCVIMTCNAAFSRASFAAETTAAAPAPAPAPKVKQGTATERGFYEVLEDLLGDFEYDLKNGQVQGLRDLAIRNLATSESVPPSFKNHLELVVTEKILANSKTRVIQCLPCKSRRTTVSGDQMVITSPETNPVELSRIAKLSGIEHFMDMAFTYQPSGMVLSMYITEPESGAVIWSRSYNSETSRASAFRRGVDFKQLDEARRANEYIPVVQYRAIAYYLFERDVAGTTGCLGFGFRMVERYDNRKKEVGFELDYLKDSSSLAGTAASTASPGIYSGFNLTLLFINSWNLIGEEENFHKVRGNLFLGIGGTYASGFLGGLVRTGYEWRLARHWAVSANLGYRPKATAVLTTETSVSGPEFGLGVSATF